MSEEKLEAAVGMSRKWDAREAGREVAESTLSKLNSDPNFFLLFSTIHYRDHGGFEEFLNGIWDVLPEGTPLVGGTVVGFMNNYGCYTRGASALAVSYPNMDVVIGHGNNTKRNPKKAATQSCQIIKNGFINSPYSNKFLFNIVSGPETMKIPGQGYKKVIDSKFMSKFVNLAFGTSQYLLQKGPGREDEVFEEIVSKLPDYHMLLGTSMDDYKWIDNYQFLNNRILNNSVVNLGISTDLNFNVYTTHGMEKTEKTFEITKLSRDGHIIHKINNKPAVQELYNLLNWPDGFLNEKTMAHTILYYPISLKRHGREVPAVMPTFTKDSVITPCRIDKGQVSILTISGRNLINAIRDNLRHFNNVQPEFGLFSSCMTILQTLGYKMNIVQEEILKYFSDKPFLMFWCAGEGTYSPENKMTYANMSFNAAIFSSHLEKSNYNSLINNSADLIPETTAPSNAGSIVQSPAI